MIVEIASFASNAVGNIIQSFGGDKLIEKVAELYDNKIRYPQLISDIKSYIRDKYCDYPFYNDFDSYIERSHIVLTLLVSIGENNIPTSAQYENVHIQNFFDEYPKHKSNSSTFVKDILNYIYDEVKRRVIELNEHSDMGKVQRLIQMEANENKENFAKIESMLSTLLTNQSQTSTSMGYLNSISKDDVGIASKNVELFLKKIDEVGTEKNPVKNDEEAIRIFQELSSDALVSLLGENPDQIKMVICSIQCHLAIHYSNLGNVDKAFECLSKISDAVAAKSKLYHFVSSVIIVNHCIEEKYDEAESSIAKALELDENYHRAFLVGEFLSALRKYDCLENILNRLDNRFASIITDNSDRDLLADYYIHRGFISKEFKQFDLTEKDFLTAKEYGYDPLVADYNLGLLYYARATEHLPRDKRVFCVDVDVSLIYKAINIFEHWLFQDDNQCMPTYIKSRMVGVYVSCCGILGTKHKLYPIEDYLSLPNLEYETKRIIILGADGILEEKTFELLSTDDQLYAKIAKRVDGNYNEIIELLAKIDDDQVVLLSDSTLYLILQASVANRDLETYRKFRLYIEHVDSLGLIECVDAFALEQEGKLDLAKKIIDKYAVISTEYKLLRNILNFYVRNGCYKQVEDLLLRILELLLNNKIFIDDKLEFYRQAIIFLIERKSTNAKRFVDALDVENSESYRLKASFYSSINDYQNLLEVLIWLCDNEFEYRFGLNKILCLIKLMRYDEALCEAKYLLETIHCNNLKDRTDVIWLISNLYLLLENDEESYAWAKKAHELTRDIPSDRSHQAFFARAMRTGKSNESLGEILEYKQIHPVIISDWMKEVKLPEQSAGEGFVSELAKLTGYSHEEYKKRESEFITNYKTQAWCTNFLLFKHCGEDFSRFFSFASSHKLRISKGMLSAVENEQQLIKDGIFVDALTLVFLQHHECLDLLKNIPSVHICYSTLEALQNNYQTMTNAKYVKGVLMWLKDANNVVWEPDGYYSESSLLELLGSEYLICCRVASENKAPLLTIETSMEDFAKIEEQKSFENLQTINVVSLCFGVLKDDSRKLSGSLYSLLADCSFINFTAQTMFDCIKDNGYTIDEKALERFFVCNSSCDMISFEKVYVTTIKLLQIAHLQEAVEFSSLVLDNALKIWRRGTHDREMSRKYSNAESKYKANAVTRYLILLVSHVEAVYPHSIPPVLETKCKDIKKKIIDEFGLDYFEELKESVKGFDKQH